MLDSEDTDLHVQAAYTYVQVAYVSHHTTGLLYLKRKHDVVLCHSLCDEDVAEVIIALHIPSGCESNSGFHAHGKRPFMMELQAI